MLTPQEGLLVLLRCCFFKPKALVIPPSLLAALQAHSSSSAESEPSTPTQRQSAATLEPTNIAILSDFEAAIERAKAHGAEPAASMRARGSVSAVPNGGAGANGAAAPGDAQRKSIDGQRVSGQPVFSEESAVVVIDCVVLHELIIQARCDHDTLGCSFGFVRACACPLPSFQKPVVNGRRKPACRGESC